MEIKKIGACACVLSRSDLLAATAEDGCDNALDAVDVKATAKVLGSLSRVCVLFFAIHKQHTQHVKMRNDRKWLLFVHKQMEQRESPRGHQLGCGLQPVDTHTE